MKVYFSRMNILNNICTENERNTIILFPVTKLYTKLSSGAAYLNIETDENMRVLKILKIVKEISSIILRKICTRSVKRLEHSF